MSSGFRVLKRHQKVSAEWVTAARSVPVANISDSMNRMFAGGVDLRPLHSGRVMSGIALTVKCRPGDNLMLHYALDIAEPGDVIVVDGGGDLTNALTGELMISYAVKKGLEGFVINGAIRDSAYIRNGDFPVFAAGVTHRGPYKDGPGEVNVPISINGMVIHPGDLVVGDDDGFLAIPYEDAEWILEKASAKHATETQQLRDIASGNNSRAWVINALQTKGCIFDNCSRFSNLYIYLI